MRQDTAKIKRALNKSKVYYSDIARLAGVSWRMVSYVIHGERTSAKVMSAIEKLTGYEAAK
jgi:DNA-binding LacI/PurR family transcriptional regulator